MTQQKSEQRIVPKATPKRGQTRRTVEGGKAMLVKEETRQLGLPFGTAEESTQVETDGRAAKDPAEAARYAEPKPEGKEKTAESANMEEVCERLQVAFWKVAANDGAAGPDRQSIEQVSKALPQLLGQLKAALLEGTYRPGDIRRVWIPKAGGGERGLGIPNVVDRMVQEAVRMVIEPLYEPTFHPSSHGFRPERSCHTAIAEAKGYVEEGYEWVVDFDLEKFLDVSSYYTFV
jgi:RNA-directed DNA polymerase